MKGSCYLQLLPGPDVYERDHWAPSIRVVAMTKNKPGVLRGTFLLKVNLELPDDAFTNTTPEVTFTVTRGDQR